MTRLVLAALPAFATLALLTRLARLLTALATLLLLAGLALAALLRIALILLVALRIVRFVSHLERSPVLFEKAPAPAERQSATHNRVPGSTAIIFCNYLEKRKKMPFFGADRKFWPLPIMTAAVGFAAYGCPC